MLKCIESVWTCAGQRPTKCYKRRSSWAAASSSAAVRQESDEQGYRGAPQSVCRHRVRQIDSSGWRYTSFGSPGQVRQKRSYAMMLGFACAVAFAGACFSAYAVVCNFAGHFF